MLHKIKPHSLITLLLISMSSFQTSFAQDNPWIEHTPGGQTLCARGEPFSFFHQPGSANKIIIDFIGGGACWDGMTCQPGSQTFFDNINAVRKAQQEGLTGIYLKDAKQNPFHDWTHVVIPYCSGDIHWGKHDATYQDHKGEDFTLYHRGAYNAESVLKWVAQNYNPEDVLITGCSAGSYGSVFWTPYIRRLFPNALMTQFGDSGAGVMPEAFFQHLNSAWKPFLSSPEWVPELDPSQMDWSTMTLNRYYMAVLASDPFLLMSQFNHRNDQIQEFFLELMMGDPQAWSQAMESSMEELAQHAQFEAITREGRQHCILPESDFLKSEDGEPSLAQWLYDYTQRPR